MLPISSSPPNRRVTPLFFQSTATRAVQLDKVCRYGNDNQSAFVLTAEPTESAISIEIRDTLCDDAIIEVNENGGLVSAAYVEGVSKVVRMASREYYATLGIMAGMCALALRENEALVPEDLHVDAHAPCILSPPAGEREALSLMDNLHLCSKCADFYCALGLEPEVSAVQEFLRELIDRRRNRSVFRWSLRGMDRPPPNPL